jgi:hypothetical protein
MVKPKVRVITADFGDHISNYNYQLPHQITKKYEVEYICYTDQNTSSRLLSLHPRLKSKIPKMLDWVENSADYYIWFDSKFKIRSNTLVDDVIDSLGDYDIQIFKHPQRKSIKSEIDFLEDEMLRLNNNYLIDRYKGERIRSQYEFYLQDPNFIDNNFFSMGFFVYSKNLIKNRDYNLMTDWFFHNCYWSIQDQISFPYLLHKHKTKYRTFDFQLFNNKYLKWG